MRQKEKGILGSMWKKVMIGILAVVLLPVLTVSAQEIDLSRTDGSITLSPLQYKDDKTGVTILLNDGEASIYLVSELLEKDGAWQYDNATGQFADVSGLDNLISRIDTENAAIARNLAAYAMGREGTTKQISEGSVSFSGLKPGLYLIVQTALSSGEAGFGPFLVSVPMQIDDEYVFQITSLPKMIVEKPETPGTEPQTEPPETEPPTETPGTEPLPDLPGGKNPPNTPSTPSTPGTPSTGTPGRLPQTGQLWWPVPVLALAGLMLVGIGWMRRRRSG